MTEAFRLTLELGEETRARWQAAAERIAYERLDVWARDALDAASDPDAGQVVEAERRECLCEICDRDYAVWFAPSELWNAVMRSGDRGNPDRLSFVCPTCFALEAESFGVVPTAWVLTQEDPDLRARLTTVETERDLLLRDQPAGVKHFRRRALAAEARVEALSYALRECLRCTDRRNEPALCERCQEVARAALACPPQQPDEFCAACRGQGDTHGQRCPRCGGTGFKSRAACPPPEEDEAWDKRERTRTIQSC